MADHKENTAKNLRPNIQLIAHEAGVAVSTVSRYLNNSSYVGTKTRQKIRGVIEKHNYRPSMMAQSLVLGHSKIIGVVAMGTDFQQDVMVGILAASKKLGMSVLLSYAIQGTRQQREAVDLLVGIQARGIIVMPESNEDSREFCEYLVNITKTRNTPIVLSGQREGGDLLDCITYDDKAAGYAATKHLIDKGFERVGCITGSRHMRVGKLRYAGYRQALIDSNIHFDPELIYDGNFHKEDGYRGIYAFSQKKKLPRAVVCANDVTALGVYLAADELGIRIPEDLAVMGCDNIEISKLVSPKLSTVNFDNASNGEFLVDLLRARIETPAAPPNVVMLDPIVIERQSTQCV
jgi:LacI family transcriptional regulator